MNSTIKKLRDRESVTTYGNTYRGNFKIFTKYQINRAEKNICWQRFESLDRRTWTEQNTHLNLKDVVNCIENNKKCNEKSIY